MPLKYKRPDYLRNGTKERAPQDVKLRETMAHHYSALSSMLKVVELVHLCRFNHKG